MSGLKQELGLAQGVGLLSTSLLGTGVFAVPALAALVAGDNSLWAWPALILLVFPIAIVFATLGRHFPSAGGVAHFVNMAFGPRLARVTGWLFLSVIPVGLPAALHIATGFGQALFGWHDSQLLLAELGTLAIIWWVGSRGASSSANLQTLVAVLLVLHFHAFGEEMAAAASLPNIVVRLFGVQALWIACVIGYLACFASLNIYIQSFARLVWSQAQYKPESYLARLSPRQIPRNALNAVLGCCVISALCIYALNINLDALIVYANGIFIMIYLLCMLAGCRLLEGRYRALAAFGSLLCLLLLAMVGWKSLYAFIMLAVLWLFLPKRRLAEGYSRPE